MSMNRLLITRYTETDIANADPAVRDSMVVQEYHWRQRQAARIYQAIATKELRSSEDTLDPERIEELFIAIMTLVQK